MFKNLRTSTKLTLLCAMFIISIAATTYSLVAEKQIAIAFARKELIGSRLHMLNLGRVQSEDNPRLKKIPQPCNPESERDYSLHPA